MNAKIGDNIYPLSLINEKQISKQLTNVGAGSRETFGKILRRRVSSVLSELTPVKTDIVNGKEVHAFYGAVINVAGVIKVILNDFHQVDDSHVAGTFFIVHAKEGIDSDHEYATYKHVLNFDEDKEKFYKGKNIKPFMPTLQTKSFTEPLNTMIKVNTHGGARKREVQRDSGYHQRSIRRNRSPESDG